MTLETSCPPSGDGGLSPAIRCDLQAIARLLATLRINSGRHQVGLLPVEVLLLVAGGARTMAELETLTGAANGPLSRAVRAFCVSYRRKGERVVVPDLVLLQRRRRTPPLRGHSLSLTEIGLALLREAGIDCQ